MESLTVLKFLIFILLGLSGIALTDSIPWGIADFIPSEKVFLETLRDSLDPSNKTTLHTNWTGSAHCNGSVSFWEGVTCSNGYVVQLDLDDKGLNGSVPTQGFQIFSELSVLSLRNNGLTGDLPDPSGINFLKQFFFSGNKFGGEIPPSLLYLTFLEGLYLENNELTGSIPPFNQTSLKVFNVSYNHLTGEIPDTVVLNSFNKSSFMSNDLMCGKHVDNCSTPSSSQPSGTTAPPSPGVSIKDDVISLVAIVGIAASLVLVLLLFSLYESLKSVS